MQTGALALNLVVLITKDRLPLLDAAFNQFIGTNVLIEDLYRKEKSSAFEVGFKGDLLDGAVNDLAGYYTTIDDMQFFEFFVGNFGLLRVVSNVDEVEVYGAELNLNAEILPDGPSSDLRTLPKVRSKKMLPAQ